MTLNITVREIADSTHEAPTREDLTIANAANLTDATYEPAWDTREADEVYLGVSQYS